jgi:hypothetical protein
MRKFDIKQNWVKIALGFLCAVLLIAYCWFPLHIWREAGGSGGQFIFSWPDETANYFFAKTFKETGKLFAPEVLNSIVKNVLHPRSFNIVGENLVPMGFVGMPLIYGAMGKLFGSGQIVFFTPLLAVLGLLCFYGILRRFFDEKFSLLGTFILGTLASFWYYSSVSMLSEIPFVALALAGFYFGLKAFDENPLKKNILFAAISGLLIAFALAIRTNEIVWLIWLIIVPLIAYRKNINWRVLLAFAAGGALPVLIVLIFNKLTYDDFFTLGYFKFNGDSTALPTGITASGPLKYLKLFFTPFGFHPRLIWHNFFNYYIALFWPYFALAGLGSLAFVRDYLKKTTGKAESVYIIAAGMSFITLAVYYGSLQITDSLVLRENTIGISYVRYWVPLIILTVPAMVYFLRRLTQTVDSRWFNIVFVALNAILLAGFSFNLAYLSEGDGLLSQKNIISEYHEQARNVKSLVGESQILVVERADKVFFPQQKVAVFDSDFGVFERLTPVLNSRKIYYFTMRNDNEINEMNAYKLQPIGMRAEFPQKIGEKFRLFELVWVPKGE